MIRNAELVAAVTQGIIRARHTHGKLVDGEYGESMVYAKAAIPVAQAPLLARIKRLRAALRKIKNSKPMHAVDLARQALADDEGK